MDKLPLDLEALDALEMPNQDFWTGFATGFGIVVGVVAIVGTVGAIAVLT